MKKHKIGYFAGALLLTIAASGALPSAAEASYRVLGSKGGFLEAEGTASPSLLDGLIEWLIGDSDA